MDKNFKNMFKDYLSSTRNLEEINRKISKKERKLKLKYSLSLITVIVLFFVSYISFNNDRKNAISLNNEDDKEVITLPNDIIGNYYKGDDFLDVLFNVEDISVLLEESDHVAIIFVNKIEGVTNYKESLKKQYGDPYTYGRARVIYEFKGKFKEKEIGFTRSGGKLPYLEWLKGDVDPDKLLNLAFQSGFTMEDLKKRVVDTRRAGDIEIAEGKLYLAFIKDSGNLLKEDYNYSILGEEYGLREVSLVSFLFGKDKIKVKDNKLNKYVYLKDILSVRTK